MTSAIARQYEGFWLNKDGEHNHSIYFSPGRNQFRITTRINGEFYGKNEKIEYISTSQIKKFIFNLKKYENNRNGFCVVRSI